MFPVARHGRHGATPPRRRAGAVVALALVAALAPSSAVAAPPLHFGTVSVGSVRILTTTVPLSAALSDLPPETVLYSGGNATIDLALSVAGLAVPLTAGALYAQVGEISATYHLAPSHGAGTDFAVDAASCATATVECTAEVTFAPTTAGSHLDTLEWTISDLDVTGGGSYASLIQLMASLIGQSFVDPLAIELTGIGVPVTGGIAARVDIAASAACIELSTSAIDFGDSTLGAEDVPADPTITVTNCSGVGETLYARGTDASGPGSAWTLVDSGATCADTLGLDAYRLGLALEDLSVMGLSTVNKSVESLGPAASTDHVARIWTACPGSTGAGVVMTMQIHYLVVGD